MEGMKAQGFTARIGLSLPSEATEVAKPKKDCAANVIVGALDVLTKQAAEVHATVTSAEELLIGRVPEVEPKLPLDPHEVAPEGSLFFHVASQVLNLQACLESVYHSAERIRRSLE